MRFYWINPVRNSLKILALILLIGAVGSFIAQGVQWRDHWQRIESRGKLIVAVRESEGIFWANGQEFTGFEKDLIDELERHLDIPIQIFAVRDLDDLYRALAAGAVDMALPGTSFNNLDVLASRAYSMTRIGLVHHKTRAIADNPSLARVRTGLLDPQAHQDVAQLLDNPPQAVAVYEAGRISAELFTLVAMQDLDQVLVDERDFQFQHSVFPDLEFTPLDEPARPISVLFNPKEDGTLLAEINDTLELFDNSGLLSQMIDRYFGHALEFDYVDNLTFEKHMMARLPTYLTLFKFYADQQGLDWRLLAAQAYQESHLRANAKSPTGVRGLMMITLTTAKEMGISDRLDPEQSIRAGAQYLTSLKNRVPADIPEPDRTWFALASYNVGAGHVEDARKITELLGDDPDRWIDVRKHLPKLSLKDYYPWTRYGYARGAEPVVYVANIRRFYNRLKKEFPFLEDAVEPERLDQLPEVDVPVFPGL
ncbi:membrane-bound lytic murein transglycosylase MltF [Reinekea sp.]|uniref:membrane-bound lytic murein transglycosylase MltF n=1 Tax=Reinekea sp. TaxID=1970455 RepID=UPI002A813A16|nr:membrane-bound lytic murein transglycosylase MltF [Reinekea sp.]